MSTCCFIGHRKIPDNKQFYFAVKKSIKKLIDDGVTIFLFGSRSKFNDLCLKIVTEFKKNYPQLIRVFVRAEYEYIDQNYENFLLEQYERTYYSKQAHSAGRLAYIKRNQDMIDQSDVCIFYYDDSYKLSTNKTSGTKIAFEYSKTKNKNLINIYDLICATTLS
ncbi:MAG: DUF1273 domain-containing protein [Bacteroides sp.]|nr:DUF1273 domain-containing protein [Bacillota bacterium]MCM1456030.1 DUF1273 domain-containing protein [Bacteroides sp.]